MAQTISEIYAIIINEVKNQSVTQEQLKDELKDYPNAIDRQRQKLAGLTSNSKVSLWRLWAFVMAVICWIQQVLFDKAKEEITVLANTGIRDAEAAFLNEIRLFEYPGTPIIHPETYQVQFFESKPALQIIKNTAITTDSLGVSLVKVAKDDGTGTLIKLSDLEKDKLIEYAKMIQPVGSNVQIISTEPDKIKLKIKIWVDIFRIPSGENIDTLKADANTRLKAAINDIDTHGKISLQKIEDTIKSMPTYKNLHWEERPTGKSNAATYYYPFQNGEFMTVAGYAIAEWTLDDIEILPYM